jgi:hypothetical protein
MGVSLHRDHCRAEGSRNRGGRCSTDLADSFLSARVRRCHSAASPHLNEICLISSPITLTASALGFSFSLGDCVRNRRPRRRRRYCPTPDDDPWYRTPRSNRLSGGSRRCPSIPPRSGLGGVARARAAAAFDRRKGYATEHQQTG